MSKPLEISNAKKDDIAGAYRAGTPLVYQDLSVSGFLISLPIAAAVDRHIRERIPHFAATKIPPLTASSASVKWCGYSPKLDAFCVIYRVPNSYQHIRKLPSMLFVVDVKDRLGGAKVNSDLTEKFKSDVIKNPRQLRQSFTTVYNS